VDAGGLIQFDTSQPWYAAVAELHALVEARDPRAELSRRAAELGVTTAGGCQIKFVPDGDAPAGRAYETHIATTGRVPTRLNPHDLFNALMWLAMPRTKARLNALQASAIAREGVGTRRGPLRDAATVFDENGAMLVTEDLALTTLVRARRWREVFVDRRGDWSAVRVLCFGHALMEKLATPYKAITAHVLVISRPPQAALSETDAVASTLLDDAFTTAELMPLPVLGVPGWCRENCDPAFYDDGTVFRSGRGALTGRSRG
jgi:Protein of unknown function (DUF3025)